MRRSALLRFVKALSFNEDSDLLATAIHYVTFKTITRHSVYLFEHRFNRKVRDIAQIICGYFGHSTFSTTVDWTTSGKICHRCLGYFDKKPHVMRIKN